MKRAWRMTVVVGLLALSTLAVAGSAAAAGKVGPDQYFTGVINGHDGNTVNPIDITVTCSVIGGTTTGHPAKGQTLAVHQMFPPNGSGLGYTGNDSEIGFFTALPPSGTTKASSKSVTFTKYDKTKKLPTSLVVPCSGTGNVYFVPLPVSPPSEAQSVPVQFVSAS